MPDMPSTKKKRKLKSTEKKQKPPKTHRIDGLHKPNEVEESESSKRQELEVASPWRNLQLILSIQKKDIELQRKVELALEYVNCKLKGGDDDTSETVTLHRLISFLNDWVQSLLISTDKKVSVGGGKLQPWCGVIDQYLDYRCWVIFKFCVDNGLRLKVSLSFSRNLLRTVGYIARNVSSLLGKQSFVSCLEPPYYHESSVALKIALELRQQKDVFGRYCFNFLCDFIWVYSGYGPLKSGIKREVDEALRPGVYALLDTCSLDDFQYLHTAFGEVPCRNTLAMLQHDYKLNFQYEGKV